MSSPNDLTTLASVEAWLGLASGNLDEALLSTLITAVSTAIETICSRQFIQQSYTETRDGTGGRALSFANYPVSAVSAVSVDGVVIPASTGSGVAGYQFSATRISLFGYRFRPGLANVSLAYTAGFATIPADLDRATAEWVAFIYKQKDRVGMVSKAIAGETTAFLTKDMPLFTQTVIAKYMKVVPV